MKFSSFAQIAEGTRAERLIGLPRPGGKSFDTLVRPLTGTEETTVLEAARASAKKSGVEKPVEGEPLYDFAIMVHTIAVGCVDPESPKEAREPSFDGGVEQVRAELQREEIAYLYARQQMWQDECSPTIKTMSSNDLLAKLMEITEANDDRPFAELRPALQWILLRITGRLLLGSPDLKWPSGSPVESSGLISKSEPEKNASASSSEPS